MTRQIYLGEVKKIKDPRFKDLMVDILWKYKESESITDFGLDVIEILKEYDFIEK